MKARVGEKDRNATHLTRLENDAMTRREINKGPTTDNGVGASSLEIQTGIFFQSRLPCGHVFEPKLNAHQCAIPEAFFEML